MSPACMHLPVSPALSLALCPLAGGQRQRYPFINVLVWHPQTSRRSIAGIVWSKACQHNAGRVRTPVSEPSAKRLGQHRSYRPPHALRLCTNSRTGTVCACWHHRPPVVHCRLAMAWCVERAVIVSDTGGNKRGTGTADTATITTISKKEQVRITRRRATDGRSCAGRYSAVGTGRVYHPRMRVVVTSRFSHHVKPVKTLTSLARRRHAVPAYRSSPLLQADSASSATRATQGSRGRSWRHRRPSCRRVFRNGRS